MRGKWVLLTVAALLIGAAAGAVSLWWQSRSTGPADPVVVPAASAPATGEQVSLTGRVVALNVLGIPAPVEGTLESVAFSIGEEVFEGELLGHIRNTAFESEMADARRAVQEAEDHVREMDSRFLALRLEATRSGDEAGRAREAFVDAEREFLRSQTLIAKGATARQQHEKVQADYLAKKTTYDALRKVADANAERVRIALNELEAARTHLAQAQADAESVSERVQAADVVSPVSGILAGVAARAGDEVHPDAGDLFLIASDLSHLAVQIDPNPDVRGKLRTGQPARVFLAELPGGSVTATVTVEESRVLVEFLNPVAGILPGLTAQVAIWPGD